MTNFNDNRIPKDNSLWAEIRLEIRETDAKNSQKYAKSHRKTPSKKLIKNLHMRLVLRDVIYQASEDMKEGLVLNTNNPLASKDTTPSHDIQNLIHYLQKANYMCQNV